MKGKAISIRGCSECPFSEYVYGKTPDGRLLDKPDQNKRICKLVEDSPDLKNYFVADILTKSSQVPECCPLLQTPLTFILTLDGEKVIRWGVRFD